MNKIIIYISPAGIKIKHPTAGELVFYPESYSLTLDKYTRIWSVVNEDTSITELMIPDECCKIIK